MHGSKVEGPIVVELGVVQLLGGILFELGILRWVILEADKRKAIPQRALDLAESLGGLSEGIELFAGNDEPVVSGRLDALVKERSKRRLAA